MYGDLSDPEKVENLANLRGARGYCDRVLQGRKFNQAHVEYAVLYDGPEGYQRVFCYLDPDFYKDKQEAHPNLRHLIAQRLEDVRVWAYDIRREASHSRARAIEELVRDGSNLKHRIQEDLSYRILDETTQIQILSLVNLIRNTDQPDLMPAIAKEVKEISGVQPDKLIHVVKVLALISNTDANFPVLSVFFDLDIQFFVTHDNWETFRDVLVDLNKYHRESISDVIKRLRFDRNDSKSRVGIAKLFHALSTYYKEELENTSNQFLSIAEIEYANKYTRALQERLNDAAREIINRIIYEAHNTLYIDTILLLGKDASLLSHETGSQDSNNSGDLDKIMLMLLSAIPDEHMIEDCRSDMAPGLTYFSRNQETLRRLRGVEDSDKVLLNFRAFKKCMKRAIEIGDAPLLASVADFGYRVTKYLKKVSDDLYPSDKDKYRPIMITLVAVEQQRLIGGLLSRVFSETGKGVNLDMYTEEEKTEMKSSARMWVSMLERVGYKGLFGGIRELDPDMLRKRVRTLLVCGIIAGRENTVIESLKKNTAHERYNEIEAILKPEDFDYINTIRDNWKYYSDPL